MSKLLKANKLISKATRTFQLAKEQAVEANRLLKVELRGINGRINTSHSEIARLEREIAKERKSIDLLKEKISKNESFIESLENFITPIK